MLKLVIIVLETVIVVILVIMIILLIFTVVLLITKQTNNKEVGNDHLKLYLEKEYSSLKLELTSLINNIDKNNTFNLGDFKEDVEKKINEQLNQINSKVGSHLGEGFDKTNKTFVNVVERLTKIDETQKSLNKLSEDVVNLHNIFNDKQTRGSFGEVQLNQIIYNVFGDNKELYEKQKTLSNNRVVDILIYAPKPLGNISIDSKFPLENYNLMISNGLTKEEINRFSTAFKRDIRNHIKDISTKYIINDETSEHAMMFIPSESVFSEIVSNHDDLLKYAYTNKVWLVSPTTLISTLTIIQTMFSNIKRDKHASEIINELKLLSIEFKRYKDRWDRLQNNVNSLSSNIKDVAITSDKIYNRFERISNTNFKGHD